MNQLIRIAHEKYYNNQMDMYNRSVEWGKKVSEDNNTEFNILEYNNLFPVSIEDCMPKTLSINNSVNYIKKYYNIKSSKKSIKSSIIARLTHVDFGRFQVGGMYKRNLDSSEIKNSEIKYAKYSLESIDNLALIF